MRQLLELQIETGHEGDPFALCECYARCSRALTDFLALRISFGDYLDILEANGVGIEEYLGVLEDNLDVAGA